jgi:PEP-CTERM motif
MSRVFLACALATLVPVAARGEPISIMVGSSTGEFEQSGDLSAVGTRIDLGQLTLGADGTGTFFFNNARAWRQYAVGFDLGLGGVRGFQIEILDPLGGADDRLDQTPYPSYVPSGYSTSNDRDGLSFAQGSGLERSATFAGGSAAVVADELTNRGDILIFSGLSGAEDARVTFGLRDTLGGRGFLLRITALADSAAVPEPASMLLIGTGLAGLAAARRRRRRVPAELLT